MPFIFLLLLQGTNFWVCAFLSKCGCFVVHSTGAAHTHTPRAHPHSRIHLAPASSSTNLKSTITKMKATVTTLTKESSTSTPEIADCCVRSFERGSLMYHRSALIKDCFAHPSLVVCRPGLCHDGGNDKRACSGPTGGHRTCSRLAGGGEEWSGLVSATDIRKKPRSEAWCHL